MISTRYVIAQFTKKLIKNFLIIGLIASCQSQKAHIELSSGEKISLRLARTQAEQAKGLSGLAPKDFSDNEAMLFIYHKDSTKSFWMPDTYFDLDIFFLNKDYMVLAVERNVPHHIGRQEPPPIYRTNAYFARHVLELKASSRLSKKIKVGDKLKVKIP